MKKALFFGLGFGLVTGLISLLSFAINAPWLDTTSRFVFLFVYAGILCYICYDAAKEKLTYGKRFLRGFLFSAVIGPVFGTLNAIAQTVYPSLTIQTTQDLFKTGDIDVTATGFKIGVIIGAVGFSILFNLVVGAMWSAIAAAIFQVNQEETMEITSKTKKEPESENPKKDKDEDNKTKDEEKTTSKSEVNNEEAKE